jgi:hypothetical protein
VLVKTSKTRGDTKTRINRFFRRKKTTACAMGGGKGPPRDWEEPRRKGKGSGGWKGEGKWWRLGDVARVGLGWAERLKR